MPVITINLRDGLLGLHKPRRIKNAANYVRKVVARHSGSEPGDVMIGKELNAGIMRSIGRMSRISVSFEKDGKLVRADLPQAEKKTAEAAKKANDAKPKEAAKPAAAEKPPEAASKAKPAKEKAKAEPKKEDSAKASKQPDEKPKEEKSA